MVTALREVQQTSDKALTSAVVFTYAITYKSGYCACSLSRASCSASCIDRVGQRANRQKRLPG